MLNIAHLPYILQVAWDAADTVFCIQEGKVRLAVGQSENPVKGLLTNEIPEVFKIAQFCQT